MNFELCLERFSHIPKVIGGWNVFPTPTPEFDHAAKQHLGRCLCGIINNLGQFDEAIKMSLHAYAGIFPCFFLLQYEKWNRWKKRRKNERGEWWKLFLGRLNYSICKLFLSKAL